MDDLDFSHCGQADAGLLRQVAISCYAPYYRDLWEPGGMEAYLDTLYEPIVLAAELADPNLRFEIACLRGEPVGFSKLHFRCDRAGTSNAAYLERVYVAPAVAGGGVGRRLIDRMIAGARERGRDWIWLQAMADAQKPLQRYRALGFVDCERTQLELPKVRPGRAAMIVLRKDLRAP
ncbi:MAG: GNAT family N-acetyltransferase [Proteobacteria bacterium]|nr:GNAT family N-acetyltransferase [Pseudomonadota bacterium]